MRILFVVAKQGLSEFPILQFKHDNCVLMVSATAGSCFGAWLQLQKQGAGGGDGPQEPQSPGGGAAADCAAAASTALVPQIQMVDGQMVLDPASLTAQAQPEAVQRRVVVDSQRLNSLSYSNRTSNERWSDEDTENFYRVRRTWPLVYHPPGGEASTILPSRCNAS
jgi:hypothetical protein